MPPPSVRRSKPWIGCCRFIDVLAANSRPRRRWSSEHAVVSALIAVALCVNSISCQQQVCTVEWSNKTNSHSFGAVRYPQLSTFDDCISSCVYNSSCLAVDVVITTTSIACWVHFEPQNIQRAYPLAGVSQYAILSRNCTNQTADCVPEWNNLTNVHSFGATLFPVAITLAECLTTCNSNSSCAAVDVDFGNPSSVKCFIHTSISNVYASNAVNQYQLVKRCSSTSQGPCSPSWTLYINTNSPNAIKFPEYQTLEDCLYFCSLMSACLAVDVNTASTTVECWIHIDRSNLRRQNVNVPDVTQYVLVNRCADQVDAPSSTTVQSTPTSTRATPSTSASTSTTQSTVTSSIQSSTTSLTTTTVATECRVEWTCLQNTHSFYGKKSECYTESACQSCCANDPQCVGVDIDGNVEPAACYTYSSRDVIAVRGPANGVKLCIIQDRTCLPSSTTTAALNTTPRPRTTPRLRITPPKRTTTTTAAPSITVDRGDCGATDWVCDGGRCLPQSARCSNEFECLDLSDELNCTSECQQANGISCSDGLCILPYQWCDGIVDCPDSSDEQTCVCKNTSYRCLGGRCIDASLRCNGRVDCPNGDDEFNCTCSFQQYQCEGAGCIYNTLVCDGIPDCPNGDDEDPKQCQNCSRNFVQCASSRDCIPQIWRCDGYPSCSDRSDELNCAQLVVRGSEKRKRRRRDTSVSMVYPDTPSLVSVKYRSSSRSYLICADGWTTRWSDFACQEMGFQNSVNTILTDYVGSDPLLVLSSPSLTPTLPYLISALRNGRSCSASQVISLSCYLQDCGWQTANENVADFNINSGSVVEPGAWPWHVAIYYDGQYECAGTIVAEQWILTSARCVLSDGSGNSKNKTNLFVRAGSIYLMSTDTNLQISSVDSIIVHPQFDSGSWFGDVALLKLTKPFRKTSTVRPVCLPRSGTQTQNITSMYSTCAVVGWTSNSISQSVPRENVLRQVRVKPQAGTRCVIGQGAAAANDNTLLCVDLISLINSCTIGSGAAIVCRDVTGTWSHIGIALAGAEVQRCGTNPFTNTAFYVDWIKNTI